MLTAGAAVWLNLRRPGRDAQRPVQSIAHARDVPARNRRPVDVPGERKYRHLAMLWRTLVEKGVSSMGYGFIRIPWRIAFGGAESNDQQVDSR